MRVAVSGTHCCGKSTLIDEFLLTHSDFTNEPEPYAALEQEYGEAFAEQPSLDDFHRQLVFNAERLRHYRSDDRVIYERSPVDFIAYMLAYNDLRREAPTTLLIEESVALATDALRLLDLIVFLPLDDEDQGLTVPDSEDPELRRAVDGRLIGILVDDDLSLFSSGRPVVLELRGSTAQRLRTLEEFLESSVKPT
jgi:hypothetical protein